MSFIQIITDPLFILFVLVMLALVAAFRRHTNAQPGTRKKSATPVDLLPLGIDTGPYVLRWSDEFDGPAGSLPDPTKWNYDVGGHGWGNNELQTYTRKSQNACLDGKGNLVVKAIKGEHIGPDGIKREYTSARLVTESKFTQKYGRIEARIKLPFGQGIWPAFWMLGANIAQVDWPNCGEIDIMENVGHKRSTVHGTLHGPGYWGAEGLGSTYNLPEGKQFADNFHVYGVEWEPLAIRFYVDGNLYHTKTPNDAKDKKWVFDHPFYILFNLAVGGNWPGYPDATTTFPQEMLVDFIRVYDDKRYLPKPE